MFLTIAVTTIVISILATRPIFTGGTFSDQDVLGDKKTNLLFFGNFYKAPFEQYRYRHEKNDERPGLFIRFFNKRYLYAGCCIRKKIQAHTAGLLYFHGGHCYYLL